jgi:hypothetical protein
MLPQHHTPWLRDPRRLLEISTQASSGPRCTKSATGASNQLVLLAVSFLGSWSKPSESNPFGGFCVTECIHIHHLPEVHLEE